MDMQDGQKRSLHAMQVDEEGLFFQRKEDRKEKELEAPVYACLFDMLPVGAICYYYSPIYALLFDQTTLTTR